VAKYKTLKRMKWRFQDSQFFAKYTKDMVKNSLLDIQPAVRRPQ